MGLNHERRQRAGLYPVDYRNQSSGTFPGYGVALCYQIDTDGGTGLAISQLNLADEEPVGFLVNDAIDVPAGKRGKGYLNVGPVPALYDTADGTPAPGETWGLLYDGSTYKLKKGYHGFIIAGAEQGGESSTRWVPVIPAFRQYIDIVGHLSGSNLTIDGASVAIIPFASTVEGQGEWPYRNNNVYLEAETGSAAKITVRRPGLWLASAEWSSQGPGRFASPFTSRIHTCNVQIYKNGSVLSGGTNGGNRSYAHFALSNDDTTPTAGNPMEVCGSLSRPVYLEKDDYVDLRTFASNTVSDSGTLLENQITFNSILFTLSYVGPKKNSTY